MSHIHYNQLEKGQRLVLQGLVPVPRKVDGEVKLIPPALENGEEVTVTEFTCDSVTVVGEDKKTKMTFAHHTGAMKLRPAKAKAAPAEPPKLPKDEDKGEGKGEAKK